MSYFHGPDSQSHPYCCFWLATQYQKYVLFNIRSCGQSSIVLTEIPKVLSSQSYEFILDRTTSEIHILDGVDGNKVAHGKLVDFVSCFSSKPFWISWQDGLIEIGKGTIPRQSRITSWQDPTPFDINGFGVMFKDSTNVGGTTWKFNVFTGKQSKKKKKK